MLKIIQNRNGPFRGLLRGVHTNRGSPGVHKNRGSPLYTGANAPPGLYRIHRYRRSWLKKTRIHDPANVVTGSYCPHRKRLKAKG